MEFLGSFVGTINTYLWSYILIALLLSAGTYFTFKTGFIQIRMLGEMFRLLGGGSKKKEGGVSSFQAFCISIASSVGTGNLAGVAIAIAIGGPGAVFWMWVVALIGAASSLVECTLAQVYKVKDGGHFRGGPAYYMEKALGKRWMGITFSILISITYGLIFNSVQANTISFAFERAFNISRVHVGIVLTVATAIIIFGGVSRIARVSEIMVPIMAIAYITVALFIIIKNITMIPTILSMIISGAFGLKQAAGGLFGVVIMQGIKRGLFSNEAGMGSAPNAAATPDVSHPVKQGLIHALGIFTDTIVICSATAFIILISGFYENGNTNGIQLTQDSIVSQVGPWGSIFIAVCILMFAFSSVIGNYYYGETNIEFISSDNKNWLRAYRILVVAMVMFGCVAKIQIVWDLADLFMGLMAIMNLATILSLSKIAFAVIKDYQVQKKKGLDPVFKASSIPGLKHAECWED
jgi:AGCS family alanine or glycine:cation symporter